MEFRISSKKVYYFLFAGVLLITFLVHASYINNGFLWLDHRDIEDKRAIVPLESFQKAFTSRYGDTGFYRPLVTIIHSIDFWLYSNWAPGFHLTNIILHLIATAILPFFLLCYFDFNSFESLICALIFGIHPVSWLPVGGISYRPEILFVIFTMLAVFFHVKARKTKKPIFVIFALISFLLGAFSKENALFLMTFLILLWEFINSRKTPISKPAYIIFSGELIAAAFYMILRWIAVPEFWRTSSPVMSLSDSIGTRLFALGFQMLILVNPLRPPLSDATLITGIGNPIPLIVLAVLALLFGVILISGVRSDLSKALFIIGISLAPSLNIIPLPRFKSPHNSYFAIAGISALVIIALRMPENKKYITRAAKFALALWLAVMTFVTFAGGFQFRNDVSLFQSEVQSDPNFLEGHFYLGNSYLEAGNYSLAANEYEMAISNHSDVIAFVDEVSLFTNLGLAKIYEGNPKEAESLLLSAEENAPTSEKPLIAYNRAVLAYNNGNYSKALGILMKYEGQYKRPEPLMLTAASLEKLNR